MARDLGINVTTEKPFYFISYNSEDEKRVALYAQMLEMYGLPIWSDCGIDFGDKFERVISERIDECECVIMFLSSKIFQKESSYVHKEYELAKKFSHKRIIPVILDKIDYEAVPYDFRPWWIDIEKHHCIYVYEYKSVNDCAKRMMGSLGLAVNKSVNVPTVADPNVQKIEPPKPPVVQPPVTTTTNNFDPNTGLPVNNSTSSGSMVPNNVTVYPPAPQNKKTLKDVVDFVNNEIKKQKPKIEEAGKKYGEIKKENENKPKSRMVAMLLSVFLGFFGIHWFYLGDMKKAYINIGIFVLSFAASLVVGILELFYLCFAALFIYDVITAAKIYKDKEMTDSNGNKLRD